MAKTVRRVGWAALAVLGLATGAAPLSAVNLSPASWYSVHSAPVPANGGIILAYSPGDLNTPVSQHPAAVTVTDEDGTHIAGTTHLLQLDGPDTYAVFVPREPFAPDHRFVVHDAAEQSSSSVEAMTLEPPALAVEVVRTISVNLVDTQCCTESDTLACIRLSTHELSGLDIRLPLLTQDSVAQQFFYRAKLDPAVDQEATPAWQLVTTIEPAHWQFQPQTVDDEYCYQIEAYRAIDGEVFVAAEGCVPSEATLVHSATDAELARDLDLATCHTPPAALTEAWCTANRERCMQGSSDCEAAQLEEKCAAFQPTSESLSTIVERSIAAPVSDTSEPADASEAASAKASSSGCSASAARVPAARLPIAFLLIALALRTRRRR